MNLPLKRLWLHVLSLLIGVNIGYANERLGLDLTTPSMTNDHPAKGLRVRQVAPEYVGTEVYHSLYLPEDWENGKKHPVLVEYTGNRFIEADQPDRRRTRTLAMG